MDKNKTKSDSNLPSTTKLIKSTVLAIVLAAIILVTTVLPAEYGIDPSGVGSLLGLTPMGEIKEELAQEVSNEILQLRTYDDSISDDPNGPNINEVKNQKGVMAITLQPKEGRELKLYMNNNDHVTYSWWTDGQEINYDAHTDSKEYHNYTKGVKAQDEGTLTAIYDGRHGWWWKNRTDSPITITLKVEGNFSDFREDF